MNIRPAELDDLPFLAVMLVDASYPPWTDPMPTPEETLAAPGHGRYLRSWGRSGDLAMVAEDADGAVGAAWCRLDSALDPGYGFVAEDVPEVTIAVVAEHRGQGVGRAVLEALINAAASQGVQALSLSVDTRNPVAVRLYERLGFTRVGGTDGNPTLLLHLAAGPSREGDTP